MPIDRAENWPARLCCDLKPRFERTYRARDLVIDAPDRDARPDAFLVRLGAPDGDDNPPRVQK